MPRGRAGPLASACYIPPHLAPTDAHTEDLTPQSNLFVAQPGCWQAQDLGAQALRRELLWFFSYVRLKIHFSASITPQFRPILGLLMLRAKFQHFRASPTKSSFVSIFGFLFLVHTDLGELLRRSEKNPYMHWRSSRAAMPDAHACRGRDGSGCGFGATRQVNSTNKKTGKTYYKRLCFQCNAGKRPASRSPSPQPPPQRRPPVQMTPNCFGIRVEAA